MMRLFFIILFCVAFGSHGFAQDGINMFHGGTDDGYTVDTYTSVTAQDSWMIFGGGNDDGYNSSRLAVNGFTGIFSGGKEDGYAFDRTTANSTHPSGMFAGGTDDGYHGIIIFGVGNIPICLGDFDMNGVIDTIDLLALLSDFGCVAECHADLNGDSEVGTGDLLLFLSLFGSTCGGV